MFFWTQAHLTGHFIMFLRHCGTLEGTSLWFLTCRGTLEGTSWFLSHSSTLQVTSSWFLRHRCILDGISSHFLHCKSSLRALIMFYLLYRYLRRPLSPLRLRNARISKVNYYYIKCKLVKSVPKAYFAPRVCQYSCRKL